MRSRVFARTVPVQYRWLAAALFAVLTIPRLAQLGMFFDGVLHASIARNMAEGHGSFWSPAYTRTLYPRFFEHPPLAFGLQSLFFRAAGDHAAVERVYALTAGALTALLVAAIWRRTIRDARGDWLPVVFWLAAAQVTFGIVNNLLETTLAVFTTAAVWMAIVAMSGARTTAAGVLAGVLVAAGFLVNGPVGLFPIAVPALYAALVERSPGRRARAVTLVMGGVLAIAAGVLAWNRPSREALDAYLHSLRVASSLAAPRDVAPWRVAASVAGGMLLRMAALVAAVWLVTRRPRLVLRGERWMAFFFALGACASVPIAISPNVTGHHFVPAIPFFAIASAVPAWRWIAARLEHHQARGAATAAGACAALLFLLTIVIPVTHGPVEARDVGLLHAIRTLGPSLPAGGVVATCPTLAADWPIHAYLQRFYRVSLDARNPHSMYLRAADPACAVPDACILIRFASGLELYSCGEGISRRAAR